jgi:hypothetical protein
MSNAVGVRHYSASFDDDGGGGAGSWGTFTPAGATVNGTAGGPPVGANLCQFTAGAASGLEFRLVDGSSNVHMFLDLTIGYAPLFFHPDDLILECRNPGGGAATIYASVNYSPHA